MTIRMMAVNQILLILLILAEAVEAVVLFPVVR
jgi:hypothetical protein